MGSKIEVNEDYFHYLTLVSGRDRNRACSRPLDVTLESSLRLQAGSALPLLQFAWRRHLA